MADQMTQNILGSFDLQMGNLNTSQLSGIAIQESLTQSNAVAMPYVEGYLQALTQAANIIVKQLPKYIKTPRTIPVVSADNKKEFVKVNDPNNPTSMLDYDDNALQVYVKANVNFSIQKTRALMQMTEAMRVYPAFAQFMNAEGLIPFLDNLEIRGVDQLKLMAEQFIQQMKSQPPQPNPAMMKLQLEQQKLAIQSQQEQTRSQLKAAEIAQDTHANNINQAKVMLQAKQAASENVVQIAKANAETYAKAVDVALKVADQQHKHEMNKAADELDTIKLAHHISKDKQTKEDFNE